MYVLLHDDPNQNWGIQMSFMKNMVLNSYILHANAKAKHVNWM